MAELEIFMQRVVRDTEQALEKYLPRSEAPERMLYEAMRYSAFSGGKRLRPVLFAAVLKAFGADRKEFFPFLAGLEMIHTYSLIHDDLPCMDNSDLRRGRPTCHRVYGEDIATLAGDGLLTEAFFVMLSSSQPADRVQKAVRLIAEMAGCGGMVSGQAAEVASSGLKHNTDLLDYINNGKTAALFVAAVQSAAILCGASEEEIEALRRYAYTAGRAYQIVDDILDITGDEDELGKPVGSDIKNDKFTYPVLLGLAGAKEAALQAAEEAVSALSVFDERADLLRAFPLMFVERSK